MNAGRSWNNPANVLMTLCGLQSYNEFTNKIYSNDIINLLILNLTYIEFPLTSMHSSW